MTADEVLKKMQSNLTNESQELVIDAETRTINIPASETLFGVKGDKNIERKYFRCPKIVGDNVDLSTHLIYIAYVYTEKNTGSIFPNIGIQPYYCDDVAVDGDDITFSWKLSENVFQSAGFIAFKMYAKEKEDSPYTVFNTTPAIGTVLYTIGDGVESVVSENPDIINQLLAKMESVQEIATPEAMQNYVNAYLEENPIEGGMTAEQERQLKQNTTDIADLKSDLPNKLDTNQGAENKGKSMVVGEDGTVTPGIPVTDVADKSVTFAKLSEDIASSSEIGLKHELLKSDITQHSGWIKFDELVNIIAVFSSTIIGNTRVYYTDEESGLDEQNPIYTAYPFYTAKVTNNSLTVTDRNALNAKYIQIAFQQMQDATMSVYGLKKEESGQIELYSKGDSVSPSNKTLEVVGTYNGDVKHIECVPGESYTVECESLIGRISIGVLIDGMFTQNPTTFPPMSNNMVVEVPQSANAIQIEYWSNKSTTIKVTGKFYGDLTRPSQKLVKENFDENILRYIRENIGGNVSGAVYYNCQDYGVISGSSDNTDAMQALIDLVHENGGGVIWIPVGIYKFHKDGSTSAMGGNAQNNVYLKSNVSILGESVIGSVFKLYGDTQTGCSMFGFFTGGEDVLEGCTFSNFTVDLSEETMAQYSHKGKAFYVSGIKDCVFRDLRLISTPSTSLGIDMLDNVVMDSIYVYQGGRQWALGGNGGAGIGIGTGKWKNENYVIRNCVCDSCGHFGIFLEDQGIFSSAKDKNYPKGQIIANNVVRNGRHYALGLRGGKNVIFTGNNTYENVGGMYLDYGAQNVIITNNIFADCTENGLLFGNEDNTVNGTPESIPCDTVFISGNLFKNNKVAIKELTVPINMEKSNNMFIGNTSES